MKHALLVSFVAAAAIAAAAQGAPASAPCRASQLSVTKTQEDGGVGHFGAFLVLTNRSGATCSLKGYLGLQLLDAKRRPMPTAVGHGSSYLHRSAPVRLVTVAPGGRARAWVEWSDVPSGSEPVDRPCEPESAYLRVTPPGQPGSIVIPFRELVCGHGGLTTSALTR